MELPTDPTKAEILQNKHVQQYNIVLGKRKVFLSSRVFAQLEEIVIAKRSKAIIFFQSKIRSFLAISQYQKELKFKKEEEERKRKEEEERKERLCREEEERKMEEERIRQLEIQRKKAEEQRLQAEMEKKLQSNLLKEERAR